MTHHDPRHELVTPANHRPPRDAFEEVCIMREDSSWGTLV